MQSGDKNFVGWETKHDKAKQSKIKYNIMKREREREREREMLKNKRVKPLKYSRTWEETGIVTEVKKVWEGGREKWVN